MHRAGVAGNAAGDRRNSEDYENDEVCRGRIARHQHADDGTHTEHFDDHETGESDDRHRGRRELQGKVLAMPPRNESADRERAVDTQSVGEKPKQRPMQEPDQADAQQDRQRHRDCGPDVAVGAPGKQRHEYCEPQRACNEGVLNDSPFGETGRNMAIL